MAIVFVTSTAKKGSRSVIADAVAKVHTKIFSMVFLSHKFFLFPRLRCIDLLQVEAGGGLAETVMQVRRFW